MGSNNTKNSQPRTTNNKNVVYVTLPYDFIPFPKQYYYPYDMNSLPCHATRENLSGYIEYTITPKSDIAIEIKEASKGRYFISGSNIRGAIRSNLEILSHSYPRFIKRSPMLYREIIKSNKNIELAEAYRKELNIVEGSNGLEKSIRVGYLQKDEDGFYVIPAERITEDKFFVSIKEHTLRNMGLIGELPSLFRNFSSDSTDTTEKFKIINGLQKKIDEITKGIELLKPSITNYMTKEISKQISKAFLEDYPFLQKFKKEKLNEIDNEKNENISREKAIEDYIISCRQELLLSLKGLIKEGGQDLDDYFSLLTDRWMLKAKIHIIYLYIPPNNRFYPYQKSVFFSQNANGGIENISITSTKGTHIKGYLYNSTNANSKRSHYLIGDIAKDQNGLRVNEDVIIGYNENLKKMRPSGNKNDSFYEERNEKIKKFYNIFDKDNFIKLLNTYPKGLVVFYQVDENNEIKNIGRTPYFKVQYKYKISDLIEVKSDNKLDYVDSLFGYVADGLDEGKALDKTSYKSRLRFSPVKVNFENINKNTYNQDVLLLTPSATSNAMYLKQGADKLITYEGLVSAENKQNGSGKNTKPELNGYKYYPINEITTNNSSIEFEEGISSKQVIRRNNQKFSGRIYFYNLKRQELGALLLSLDIEEFQKTKKFKNEYVKQHNAIAGQLFEQIGGAKPYGYGSVQIDIEDIKFENVDNTYEALMKSNYNSICDMINLNNSDLIDDFLDEMIKHDAKYLDYLEMYINSKTFKGNNNQTFGNGSYLYPKKITWSFFNNKNTNNTNKQVGYPKTWRLKLRENSYTK